MSLNYNFAASELHSIFYSVLDNTKGSIISHQYPHNSISDETYKSIDHIVIPRPELFNKCITVQNDDLYIIGCPQNIKKAHYERNYFTFNICFTIKPKQLSNMFMPGIHQREVKNREFVPFLRPIMQIAYESLVSKLNSHFFEIEQESLVLSKSINQPEMNEKFAELLQNLYTDLKSQGKFIYQSDGVFGDLYMKFTPQWQNLNSIDSTFLLSDFVSSPTDYEAYEEEEETLSSDVFFHFKSPTFYDFTEDMAFIATQPHFSYESTNDQEIGCCWECNDLTSRKLILAMDGKKGITELAKASKIDINVARLCLANLSRLSVAHPVNIVNYVALIEYMESGVDPKVNGYMALPKLTTYFENEELIDSCIKTVLINVIKIDSDATEDTSQDLHQNIDFEMSPKSRRILADSILMLIIALCTSQTPFLNVEHLLNVAESNSIQLLIEIDDEEFIPFMRNGEESKIIKEVNYTKIDLIRLIQFAELNELLRPKSCYPISDSLLTSDNLKDALENQAAIVKAVELSEDKSRSSSKVPLYKFKNFESPLISYDDQEKYGHFWNCIPCQGKSFRESNNDKPSYNEVFAIAQEFEASKKAWKIARQSLMDGRLNLREIVLELSMVKLSWQNFIYKQVFNNSINSDLTNLPMKNCCVYHEKIFKINNEYINETTSLVYRQLLERLSVENPTELLEINFFDSDQIISIERMSPELNNIMKNKFILEFEILLKTILDVPTLYLIWK